MFNKIKNLILLFIFIVIVGINSKSIAMTHYQIVPTPTGLVTATVLNVRKGPGTNFGITTVVYKNEYIRLFAKIGKWYVIQTDDDNVGCVSSEYVKLIYPESANSDANTDEENTTSSVLTQDELNVFNLINEQRRNNGLSELKIDDDLQNVARIKAQDMVDNNYFAHNSPAYGTPFNMLKSFGVKYKSAGENIAGNSNNKAAVTAWMNSEGHRANILNSNYEYTGVAVVTSPTYGKVYVQMFIKK